MTISAYRREFQRANLYVAVVAHLFVTCIAAAGCTLCVRTDGQMLLHLKYGKSQCCLPRPLCTLCVECAPTDENSGGVGNGPCKCHQCCDEIAAGDDLCFAIQRLESDSSRH